MAEWFKAPVLKFYLTRLPSNYSSKPGVSRPLLLDLVQVIERAMPRHRHQFDTGSTSVRQGPKSRFPKTMRAMVPCPVQELLAAERTPLTQPSGGAACDRQRFSDPSADTWWPGAR